MDRVRGGELVLFLALFLFSRVEGWWCYYLVHSQGGGGVADRLKCGGGEAGVYEAGVVRRTFVCRLRRYLLRQNLFAR